MKAKLTTLAVAAALAAPAAAQAPGRTAAEPKAGAGSFQALDRNNDGYLSRDEARDAPWSNRFSEMDRDNDGRLSLGEFDAMRQEAASGASAHRDARDTSTPEKP